MNKIIYVVLAFVLSGCFTVSSAEHRPMMMMPESPNTVEGLKKVAEVGDYVLLRGRFINRADKEIYEFHDDEGKALFVSFEGVKIPSDLTMNYEYFLWGVIARNDKLTILNAKSLSPKRF